MKRLGFDQVYDTSFSADLTVIEEANEFLGRKAKGEQAAAVHELLPGLGEVRGTIFPGTAAEPVHLQIAAADARRAVPRRLLPAELGVAEGKPGDGLDHALHGQEVRGQAAGVRARTASPDVDHVLTTQELARMIEEAGPAVHASCSRNRSTCRWASRPARA